MTRLVIKIPQLFSVLKYYNKHPIKQPPLLTNQGDFLIVLMKVFYCFNSY